MSSRASGSGSVIGLVWAQARDHAGRPVIGAGGQMPWHLPEDLAHFRALTEGHPVVMGRRTWESLPARFRPLPGRTNVVVTRREGWSPADADAVLVAPSLPGAFALAGRAPGSEEIWVIGGGQVYAEALAVADRCVITEVDLVVEGDTFAPTLDSGWVVVSETSWERSRTGTRYRFCTFERYPG